MTSCWRLRTATPKSPFTRDEIEGAEHVGEGVYRLKSGALLRFFSSATIH